MQEALGHYLKEIRFKKRKKERKKLNRRKDSRSYLRNQTVCEKTEKKIQA